MTVATPQPQAGLSLPLRPVVIDTDPGIDDALALMLALRSPEWRVELLTTVAGNVPVSVGTANARRLVALINAAQSPAVAQGAAHPLRRPLHTATAIHGDDGLGGLSWLRRADGGEAYPVPAQPPVRRQAVQRLVRLVEQHGRTLTVIALGPLTNIARAIQLAPASMRGLGHLVIMGGAIAVPGNIRPVAEFNIFVDPHAADLVLRSGIPITLVPLDVTRQVRLTAEVLQRATAGVPMHLTQAVRHMTQQALQSQPMGLTMHDPLAVAVALEPTLVQTVMLPVRVETRGIQTLGMTVADRRQPSSWTTDMPQIEVALEVDASRALELFTSRVLGAEVVPTVRRASSHA